MIFDLGGETPIEIIYSYLEKGGTHGESIIFFFFGIGILFNHDSP